KGTDGSTIKVHRSTLPGSVSRIYGKKRIKHVFSPAMYSRSDFVITRKKLIHNSIDESKKPSLKPSPKSGIEPDEWIKDSGCSKHMTGNKSLFSTYKAYDGGNVVFGSNLKGKIIGKGRYGVSVPALTKDHKGNKLNTSYLVKTNTSIIRNPGNRGRDAGNAGYRERDNGKRPAREEDEKALVVQDGLGYDSQFNEKEVLYVKEDEVTEIVFDNRLSDEENSIANDRFKKGKGFHVVPPSLTGNYMPPKPDLSFVGLDDHIYKFKISETVTSLSKDVKDAPETNTAFVEKPKEVRTSAPIIQEWDTDSDNDSVFRPKHIHVKINFVKAVIKGEDSRNPPESQPIPSPAQLISESQILESSSSPQNTQHPRQTLEGTSFPHTRGPNFPDLSSGPERQETIRGAMAQIRFEGAPIHGPERQETIRGAMAQIRFEGAPIQSSDPPLSTGNTVRSKEDMMEHEIKLTDPVLQTPHDSPLSGDHTPKSDEVKEIASLQKKVTKLEPRKSLRISGFHPFRAGISRRQSLGSTAETVSTARPNISASGPEVGTAEPKNPLTTTTLFDDEDVTIADTLVKMKIQKAKEKGVAFKDVYDSARPIRSITTLQPILIIDPKDKELDEEVIIERKRQEEASKAALAELYDEKWVDAFVPIGSEEDEKRVGSRKKGAPGSSLKQKSPKKKVNDQESIDSDKELKKWLKLVLDDDKAINYETLDVKSPIGECESQVLGTMVAGDVHVYKLTRLDGSYRYFLTFCRMLEVLDRQDVLDLHKIVMERCPTNNPKEKRYPLTKEILKKMLSWRLEAESERRCSEVKLCGEVVKGWSKEYCRVRVL
nr:integrase, catalytic region, zinc finger, CCHC-type, peptidase aspartic, catalytic [Tanacetum cinerariifolium]